jgi:hypothetical protein
VGEWQKKKETVGMEEENSSLSVQGLRVNLGGAAAVHCFSDCDSRELKSNLHASEV